MAEGGLDVSGEGLRLLLLRLGLRELALEAVGLRLLLLARDAGVLEPLLGAAGRGFGLLQARLDGVEGGGLSFRDRLHRLFADRAGVAGLQALADGQGGVVAVRLLLLGSSGGLPRLGVGFGLLEIREALLLLQGGLPGFVEVSSLVGDDFRGPRVALLEADELVGEGLRGEKRRVAGFVEAVGVLLRLELVELRVERLLRLAGSVECRLGSLSAGGFVGVVLGQARLVLAV